MKVWTITSDTDSDGPTVAVHPTEATAKAHFARIVAASWESWVRDEKPWPGDAMVAYAALCDTVGFFDLISMQEHEVTLPDTKGETDQ